VDHRFTSETHAKRYEQITTLNFAQEKGFSIELLGAVPEIYHELKRRNWEKFNTILQKVERKPGNTTLVKEFFANSFSNDDEDADEDVYEVAAKSATLVRGVKIDWSPTALNAFLGTTNKWPCPLFDARSKLECTGELGRRVIKDFVCRPGTPWLKCSTIPTKVQLTQFKPICRA
jgi:hypothetical protein